MEELSKEDGWGARVPYWRWPVLLLVCLLGLGGRAFAAQAVDVTHTDTLNLWPRCQLLVDKDQQLDIDAVSGPAADRFHPVEGRSGRFGFTSDIIWLRFTLTNSGASSRSLRLRAGHSVIDDLRLYLPRTDGFRVEVAGDWVPYHQRSNPFHQPLFSLTLPPHSQRTYYLRVASQSTILLPLKLYSPLAFEAAQSAVSVWNGAFYGIVLLMALYHLMLFLALRERTYLHYALAGISTALYFFVYEGYAAQYWWPDSIWLSNRAVLLFGNLALLFGVLFQRNFLILRPPDGGENRALSAILITSMFQWPLLALGPYRPVAQLLTLEAGLAIVVSFIASVAAVRRGDVPARWFLMAWLGYWMTLLWWVLELFGWIESESGMTAVKSGVVLFLLFSSFALAERIREMRRRTDRAHARAIEAERDQSRRLEQAVKARTADYRRATLTAEQANALKDRFLAMVAHEIRNPISAALGSIRLLLDTSLTREQRALMEGIGQSGDQMVALLDDLQDLSLLQSGRFRPAREPFALVALVESTVSLVEGLASEKGLALKLSVGDVPEWVCGDSRRLRQVLLNLLTNAVKYTSRGHITVDVQPFELEAHLITFAVSDTGAGIPAEEHAMLFTPFTRLTGAHESEEAGIGLGLAIARELVEVMGGEIGVDSEPGRGSYFWFALPLEPAEVAESQTLDEALVPGAPLSILLAEDTPLIRQVVTQMLEREGYRVRAVTDGAEAVEAADETHFDAILMDIRMPRLDGWEASRRIRASSGNSAQVPILAFTAKRSAEVTERCLEAGMSGMIDKPFDPQQLRQILATIARGESAITPAPAAEAVLVDEAGLARRGQLLGRESLMSMVAAWHEGSEAIFAALGVAGQEGDWARVAELAHRLVGSAATLGLPALSEAARRLEEVAQGLHPTAAGEALTPLADCWRRTNERLEGWVAAHFGETSGARATPVSDAG